MPITRRRDGKLPSELKRAITELEASFFADGARYETALTHLSTLTRSLSEPQRVAVDARLRAAHERIHHRQELDRLRTALAGEWTSVRELPGHQELVSLNGTPKPDDPHSQMLLTVPSLRPGAGAEEDDLIGAYRAALQAGRCSRCGAELALLPTGEAVLEHRRSCPIGQERITEMRQVSPPGPGR